MDDKTKFQNCINFSRQFFGDISEKNADGVILFLSTKAHRFRTNEQYPKSEEYGNDGGTVVEYDIKASFDIDQLQKELSTFEKEPLAFQFESTMVFPKIKKMIYGSKYIIFEDDWASLIMYIDDDDLRKNITNMVALELLKQ